MRLPRNALTPFVAVAICAPAAFAASDLRGSSTDSTPSSRSHGLTANVAGARSPGTPSQPALALERQIRTTATLARRYEAHTAAAVTPITVKIARVGTAHDASQAGPAVLTSARTQTVPGRIARLLPDGFAAAPADAPAAVQQAIWAGNQLIGLPYVFGGGHGGFVSGGYDCSGSVSFALRGGNLLSAPLDSSEFLGWGDSGHGSWITVYTNNGHAFMEIAGIRFDTSQNGDPNGESGPRWRPLLGDTAGFEARHPQGY